MEPKLSPPTIPDLFKRKTDGPPITMVTAYDAFHGSLLREAGIDIALVGDSLGMVVQGHASTLPVTTSEMIYHSRLVARGLMGASLLVTDLPFLSYQPSIETAIREAGSLIKEGGANAVKLEGGKVYAETVKALVSHPHLGTLSVTLSSIMVISSSNLRLSALILCPRPGVDDEASRYNPETLKTLLSPLPIKILQ